jgi:DNA-directed RNA polymerase III subunit RPC8
MFIQENHMLSLKVAFMHLVILIICVVKFRLIVFRPFVGEVLVGRIRSCSEEGISVSLTFFDDIFIPAHCLQTGTTFNLEERLWVWNYDGNELFMDLDEKIRFRVLTESFAEVAPVQKEALLAAVANKLNGSGSLTEADQQLALESVPTVPPYKIIASVAEDGLGLLSWWGLSG